MHDDNTDSIARSWLANAGAWTRAVRERSIESRRLITDDAIVAAVRARAPSRVLDVGCGEGWLCRALAAHGMEAVGVDASAPLIEAARALGGGTFVVASFDDIATDPSCVGAAPFDAVVCNFALFERDIAALLTALRACLANDGAVIIQTVHPHSVDAGAAGTDGWRTEDFASLGDGFVESMPWYLRSVESWTEVLKSAGLNVASLEQTCHPRTGQSLSLLFVATAAG